jgi:beta-glucosidase
MVNGGDLNGTPIHVSKKLLIDTLRNDLGYQGITMSDWEDVYRLVERHKVVRTKEEALLRSFNSGLDMNMAVADLEAVDILEKLVKEGKITEDYLNQVVSRILRVKFELGLFDFPQKNMEEIAKRQHQNESKKLAQQLVLESLTLLKNDNHILPLNNNIKSILVTGKTANSKRHMCGGWTLNWASANEEDLDFPTILEVLQSSLDPDVSITYAPTIEALSTIQDLPHYFDVCISIVGEGPHSEWLGDSNDLAIEQEEQNVLKEAKKIGVPLIIVSLIGRPQKINWMAENADAILWAYLPGSEGSKPIVDVLLGHQNPSGKLPMTFPKDANQIPILYNARRYFSYEIQTKYEPLFSFGYGLSYTTFQYRDLQVPSTKMCGEDITISVLVKNTGEMTGTEVVQVYMEDVYASVTRPLKSLKAFQRVTLEPNEEKRVELTLTPNEFSLFDEELQFIEEPREIDIIISNLTKRIKIG